MSLRIGVDESGAVWASHPWRFELHIGTETDNIYEAQAVLRKLILRMAAEIQNTPDVPTGDPNERVFDPYSYGVFLREA